MRHLYTQTHACRKETYLVVPMLRQEGISVQEQQDSTRSRLRARVQRRAAASLATHDAEYWRRAAC
jgi:hypothetical protein